MSDESATWVDFNVNDYVKIKPTQEAILKHRENRRKFWGGARLKLKSTQEMVEMGELKLDQDGWVKMQMWEVMEQFGHMISLGCQCPFDPQIKIKLSQAKQ